MPVLLEIQQAVAHALVTHDDEPASAHILGDALPPAMRLNIYRNTSIVTLTTALRLSYPAVQHLVGPAFFEGATRMFIEAEPPRSAWLDEYGEAFPAFLARFAPATSLPYLSGVARLEWAVSRALHAADINPLDLSCLSAIDLADHGRICFSPHPSVSLVESDYPVDLIWRAVLARDDEAMASIDLDAGPVWLLVHRQETATEVIRCDGSAWRFAEALFASRPLQTAIEAAPDVDASILLADHLAAGRFVTFKLAGTADIRAAESR